ncbi:MAG: bacillithiol biosynthesis cysteine-adding enzyme BshC [Robiginitalea sp.]
MHSEGIPFKETGFFSRLILDYLDQLPELNPFYGRFPAMKAFEGQIEEKGMHFPLTHRKVLCEVLNDQYASLEISNATREYLEKLQEPNTFTVVTGHQLNLFTGPLYFIYKILSTIKLANILSADYPDHHFVPVYWMGTEDHDFEEVNHFNLKGKEIRWNRESGGAVGRMDTRGLEAVFDKFSADLGPGKHADSLRRLFHQAYLEHSNMAEATRYLVNQLFGDLGLVILDADDRRLKTLFTPYVESDLFGNLGYRAVTGSIERLNSLSGNYRIQVSPRELNFFYLTEGFRSRLVEEEGVFGVLDSDLRFSEAELREELEKHPERFSPNVTTRPLYQEVVLPNLCYIGGGGELAYWLELKDFFAESGVPFPMLLLRNSALLVSEKQRKKIENLGLGFKDLFLDPDRLVEKKVRDISDIEIDLSQQRHHLQQQFKSLYELAEKTDKSFLGAVKAQEAKQLSGLDKLEKRLLKAQKRKLKDAVDRVLLLQEGLFPEGGLQERNRNFSEFFLSAGPGLLGALLEDFEPLGQDFSIFTYPL